MDGMNNVMEKDGMENSTFFCFESITELSWVGMWRLVYTISFPFKPG